LPAERREAVIRAAQVEFGAHGFSGASLNTIAKQAGVAKGSLFQYFDDKASLYVHLGEVAAMKIRADMEAQLADLPWTTDFFAATGEMLRRWEEYFHTHPNELAMTAAVNHEPDVTAQMSIREAVNPHYLGVVRPLVELALATDQLREDADVDVLVSIVLLYLPHIAVSPHRAGLDPVLGLSSPDRAVRVDAIARLTESMRHAFGRTATSD
jgi:AcrR family transcriptional regulator